jgi:C1A family cysteine protease
MRFVQVGLAIGLWSLIVVPAWGQLSDADIAALREQGQREGWTFTITKNEATQYPLSQLCGVVRPKDWAVGARFDPCNPRRTLPAAFDWRNYNGHNYCTPIKDQDGCGSCWAFGLLGAVESNILIKDLTTTDLSEQWLVSCTGVGGCSGAWPGDAANFLLDNGQYHDPCGGYGAVMEADFPYVAWDAPCNCPYSHPYKLDNWAFIGDEWGIPTVDQLKQAILDHGPITVCVYASGAFQGYGGGIFNACSGTEINHAVALVGWDDNQGGGVWFLRNSWGPGWGEGGYMKIVYNCSLVGYNALYVDYPGSANMDVTPTANLSITGPVGGPFDPPGIVYTLTNSGALPVSYSVAYTASWLSLTNASGTLPGNSSLDVAVSLDPSTYSMPAGRYSDTLVFTNFTNHRGDTTRSIGLQIGEPVPMLTFTLDSDPGWATQGEWAFGQPTGQGGGWPRGYPDPTSGATGQNVYGVNLNGDYSTQYGGPYFLTLGPLDLRQANTPIVKFQRWLNTDCQPYVRAMIQASANGTTWTQLWANSNKLIRENAWSLHEYTLPPEMGFCPTVYVRWGYQIFQNAMAFSGWNIDDVEIWAFPRPYTPLPGDLNCDGVVDFGDINPFVTALTNPVQYPALYPDCDIMNADMNQDGSVDFGDINPFVNALLPPG